jgi:hypothetical protein
MIEKEQEENFKPKNWKFLAKTLVDVSEEEKLLIYTVTWNMMGLCPDINDVENLLMKKQKKFFHIYAVSSQECMRSIFYSFFNSNKDQWILLLQ